MAKGNGKAKRYDWTTRDGRAALDKDVLGVLLEEATVAPIARLHVALRLRVDVKDERAMDAVSASLRRGVRDGWARQDGERGKTRYAAAK